MKDRIDTLARLLFDSLPSDARAAGDSLRQNFSDVLSAKFDTWGLATSEEFQKSLENLRQCRERIEELERRLDSYENRQ